MEVQTEALELRVGVRPTRDLPRIAADAVSAGNYSSALQELAGLVGLSGGDRSGVIGRLSDAARRDLGVSDMSREEAAELLVRRYAGQIIDGNLRPIDGGAKINRAVVEMGWDGGGQPLWDEGACEIYQLMDMNFCYPQPSDDERRQFIEDGIVTAARRLTQT